MKISAPDPIIKAFRLGHKDEALRLIAEKGVWMPFRDPGYFDTETCFPVFTSLELIPPFLRRIGAVDDTKDQSIKAHQVGGDFFSFASCLDAILTLNPGTDSEWKFGPAEFHALAAYTKNRANQSPEPTPTAVTPPAGQEARQP
jgi:hypothetical protein